MNNEVIIFGESQQKLSSLEIAELTGKQHKDVMKAIRNMEPAWVKVRGRKFALSSRTYEIPNGGTREVPCYLLTKTECLYIATKFDDEARAKLVLRWKELEVKERSNVIAMPNFSNPAEAARAWAEQYEKKMIESKRAEAAEQQVITLSQEIEQMQPKANYYDIILNNKSTVLTTQIALDYGLTAKAFNQKLYDLRIQHKVNDQWILYSPYITMGYMHSKPVEITKHDGRRMIKYNSEWTQKGRLFLYDLLKKHNILPLIEMEE